MANDATGSSADPSLTLTVGREQLVIQQRYYAASIFNDFLIGAWFSVGSVLFLDPALVEAGTWLFILGSVQLLLRPGIRLARYIHLRRVPPSGWDF